MRTRIEADPVHAAPEHDSLFSRFEQLDALLATASDPNATFLDVWRAARDARTLAGLIRRQAIK